MFWNFVFLLCFRSKRKGLVFSEICCRFWTDRFWTDRFWTPRLMIWTMLRFQIKVVQLSPNRIYFKNVLIPEVYLVFPAVQCQYIIPAWPDRLHSRCHYSRHESRGKIRIWHSFRLNLEKSLEIIKSVVRLFDWIWPLLKCKAVC